MSNTTRKVDAIPVRGLAWPLLASVLVPVLAILLLALLNHAGVRFSIPAYWLVMPCLPGIWLIAARLRWWAVLAAPCYLLVMFYLMFVEALWLAPKGSFP